MIATVFAFAFSIAPFAEPGIQDPPSAMAQRLEALGATGTVSELLAAAQAAPRPGAERAPSPGLEPLEWLEELRLGGQAIDPLLQSLDIPQRAPLSLSDLERWMVRVAVNGEAQAGRGPKPLGDIRKFEDQLEEIHRDLRGLLGHGVELYEVVPQLHSAMGPATGGLPFAVARDIQGDVLDRLRQVERSAVLDLGRQVLVSTLRLRDDRGALARLAKLSGRESNREYVRGEVLLDRETSFGRMVIGGKGPNTYDCSQIDVIIDLGGDDTYDGPAGATGPRRRLGVVCDLAGNDTYRGGSDSLGSATYGIGVLVDVEGDDVYEGGDRSGGFGAAGFGAWVDLDGNDKVTLGTYCGGTGLAGFGLLWDRAGDDVREAGSHGFGLGVMAGVGMLVDGSGSDTTTLGAQEVEDDVRGVALMSYGLGFGAGAANGWASGGVGFVIDGAGNDAYFAGGSAMGAGAHGGLGVLFDRSGDDRYDGGAGSLGAAYARGLGVAVDTAGDDAFAVSGMGLGAAVSHGQAWFADFVGEDRYRLMGFGMGEVLPGAVAGFFDAAGVDDYLKEGVASVPWAARGSEEPSGDGFALFLDEGEADDRYRWNAPMPAQNGEEARYDMGPQTLRVDR